MNEISRRQKTDNSGAQSRPKRDKKETRMIQERSNISTKTRQKQEKNKTKT